LAFANLAWRRAECSPYRLVEEMKIGHSCFGRDHLDRQGGVEEQVLAASDSSLLDKVDDSRVERSVEQANEMICDNSTSRASGDPFEHLAPAQAATWVAIVVCGIGLPPSCVLAQGIETLHTSARACVDRERC
jgi:hypothetical protein